MTDTKINRKYKDRLFRLRFGSEEYKEDILSLYNALNGTSYDVSFLLDGNIPLWEQQGSVNPNMPVRGLMYFGNLYDQYIKVNELNIYGKNCRRYRHRSTLCSIMARKIMRRLQS